MNRVQVIGAGAVGLLIASYLQQEGLDVHLVCRREEQVEKLKEGIVRHNVDSSISIHNVRVSTKIEEFADLNIICIKNIAMEQLISVLPNYIPTIFVQNGLSHTKIIDQSNLKQVAYGSAQFGVKKVNDYTIDHNGIGILKMAYKTYGDSFLERILEIKNEQFPIIEHMDVHKMLMEKAIYNSLVNPLTAILQVKNGELLTNSFANQMLRKLHKELQKAFPIYCPKYEDVVSLCEKTALNTSSMLADHKVHKKSEVEAIVKPLLQAADEEMPIMQTIYELVVAIESKEEWRR